MRTKLSPISADILGVNTGNLEGNNEVGLQHYYMAIQRREYNRI